MTLSAVRSRLLQLRRDVAAARDGRDLLDRKREAILRALADRLPRLRERHQVARAALEEARASLVEAQLELGRTAVDAAAFAQPPLSSASRTDTIVAGVRLPQLEAVVDQYGPHYGPATGSPSLDRAGAAFRAAIAPLVALASEEAAVSRLRAALARTARRLNALDCVVLPDLSSQIRLIAAALEEEERDEAVRRKQQTKRVLEIRQSGAVLVLISPRGAAS